MAAVSPILHDFKKQKSASLSNEVKENAENVFADKIQAIIEKCQGRIEYCEELVAYFSTTPIEELKSHLERVYGSWVKKQIQKDKFRSTLRDEDYQEFFKNYTKNYIATYKKVKELLSTSP